MGLFSRKRQEADITESAMMEPTIIAIIVGSIIADSVISASWRFLENSPIIFNI